MSNNTVQYVITLKDLFSSQIKDAVNSTEKLNDSTDKLNNTFTRLGRTIGTAFAIREIYQFGKSILDVSMQVEGFKNQMGFASGSMKQGAADFEYVSKLSNSMGWDLASTADAFAKFQGAVRGSSIEGKQSKNIFEGVSMAASVMHLSAEESAGSLYALQQMMSKGRVYSEELTRQLGERMPGALGIAARAMGTTKAELLDMMKKGEVMSEVFLPRFGNQLKKEFAGGLEQSAKSGMANFNRMNNSIYLMKLSLSETLMPVLSGFVRLITKTSNFIRENKSEIIGLTVAFSSLYLAFKSQAIITSLVAFRLSLLKAGTLSYTIATIAAEFATGGFKNGLLALNIALSSNPIGAVVAVIGLLASGVVYAYSKFEGFRNLLSGIWQIMKELTVSVYNLVAGFLTLDPSQIMKGVTGFSQIGGAFERGWNASKYSKTNLGKLPTGGNGGGNGGGGGGKPPKGPSDASKVSQPKATQIHINIGKLVETQNIKIENATKDFAQKLHTAVAEVLLNVVNDTNRIATQ